MKKNVKDNIPFIRIDGIVPQNKTAIREALEVAPENVMLIWERIEGVRYNNLPGNVTGNRALMLTEALEPGETLPFTDGSGKYYGNISRSMDGAFLLDANVPKREAK